MHPPSLTQRIEKLLAVAPGEWARLSPFLLLYLVLFAMLTLADNISMVMVIKRVGSHQLPLFYGLSAATSAVALMVFSPLMKRYGSKALFIGLLGILAAGFVAVWLILATAGTVHSLPLMALLFLVRELAYTLVVMQFGNFLPDYFSRTELNRVLPVVYSGGRLGGVVATGLMALLGTIIPVLHWVLVVATLCALSAVWIWRFPAQQSADEHYQAAPLGFVAFFKVSALWRWLAISGVLFVVCRWVLNFQVNQYFEAHKATEQGLIGLLGWYGLVATTVSFLIQLLGVNRLVQRFGLGQTYAVFNGLFLIGMLLTAQTTTLMAAFYGRFVESELRIGLRNPLSMLITNHFDKSQRKYVRAWLLGALNPLATFLVSVLLWGVMAYWASAMTGMAIALAVLYGFSTVGLLKQLKGLSNHGSRSHHSAMANAELPVLNA